VRGPILAARVLTPDEPPPDRPAVVATHRDGAPNWTVVWRGPRGQRREARFGRHRTAVRFATDLARLPERSR